MKQISVLILMALFSIGCMLPPLAQEAMPAVTTAATTQSGSSCGDGVCGGPENP